MKGRRKNIVGLKQRTIVGAETQIRMPFLQRQSSAIVQRHLQHSFINNMFIGKNRRILEFEETWQVRLKPFHLSFFKKWDCKFSLLFYLFPYPLTNERTILSWETQLWSIYPLFSVEAIKQGAYGLFSFVPLSPRPHLPEHQSWACRGCSTPLWEVWFSCLMDW